MPNLFSDPSEKHMRYLDSARGIAAVMVFVAHFCDYRFHGKAVAAYICFVFNGSDAVSFFFVLSGFVLSYKYVVLNKPLDLKKFYVSRFFRLWPAYFITVVSCCIYHYYHANALTGQKLADIFIFNKDYFWEEAFLLRFHNSFYYPGWTLTMEMVGSFLLPFYILIAVNNKKLVPYLMFVFLFIAGQNFFCSIHFLLGLLISCYYTKLNKQHLQTMRWYKYRYIILFAAIAIWPIRHYDQLSPFGPTYKYLAEFFAVDFNIYTGLASFVFLIAIILSVRTQKILESKPLVFIGKLSYSIYLVHILAINIVYDYIQKILPFSDPGMVFTAMIIIYLVLIFVLAMLMHYLVELPFMRMGKRVVKKMKPSIVISGTSS